MLETDLVFESIRGRPQSQVALCRILARGCKDSERCTLTVSLLFQILNSLRLDFWYATGRMPKANDLDQMARIVEAVNNAIGTHNNLAN